MAASKQRVYEAPTKGESMSDNQVVRAWHIGEYGEVFAGYSEQQVKDYYRDLSGYSQEEADARFAAEFTEIPQSEMDVVMPFNDGGEPGTITWRQLAEDSYIPSQISTTYV